MTNDSVPVGSEIFEELIRDAIDLTNDGKLEWRAPERSGATFEYEADIGHFNVDISSADDDGELPYVFRVFPQQGEMIAEINSRHNREWNAPLGELYRSIARQVTRIDLKLEPLLQELRALKNQQRPN